MQCINSQCGYTKTKVYDSRKIKSGRLYKRRRMCHKCRTCFTSFEIPVYLGKAHTPQRYVAKKIRNYFGEVGDPYYQWQFIMLYP
jgi:transcriptional regulator NrdR family protein